MWKTSSGSLEWAKKPNARNLSPARQREERSQASTSAGSYGEAGQGTGYVMVTVDEGPGASFVLKTTAP